MIQKSVREGVKYKQKESKEDNFNYMKDINVFKFSCSNNEESSTILIFIFIRILSNILKIFRTSSEFWNSTKKQKRG